MKVGIKGKKKERRKNSNLANRVKSPTNQFMQRGSSGGITTSAGAYTDLAVVFDTPYDVGTTPTVCLTTVSDTTSQNYAAIQALAVNKSNTGFTIRIINGSTGNASPAVNWLAVGNKS